MILNVREIAARGIFVGQYIFLGLDTSIAKSFIATGKVK